MPDKSAKQYGLMGATLGGASTGVPKKVAQHFMDATPKKKKKKFAQSLMEHK